MIDIPKRNTQKAVYFHEDDYCQIEILPLSNRDFCVDEMKKVDEFADAHRAAIGWTDVYLRSENPKSLIDFSISVNDFRESVEKTLAPYSEVTTGYSTHVETCKNTLAWGIGEREFTIFANFTDENIIDALWLDLCILKKNTFDAVMETFENLPRRNELMIADWNSSQVINIGDETSLRNYLSDDSELE